MNKLEAATTCDWIIDGIEFTTVNSAPKGSLLVPGIVRNPEWGDVWFFGKDSYEASGLQHLIYAGYLEIFRPEWCDRTTGCFCIRLKLDDGDMFEDGSEPATCFVCGIDFNFHYDGDNLIQTSPGTGPSYSCGGEPPEYDPVCTPCIGAAEEGEDGWNV